MQVRKSQDRGTANLGWLNSKHTFSFADYFDRNHMGFHQLRVINEDIIKPSQGFGMHPHQNMEIITYMLSGTMRHKDSEGNTSVLKTGEVQRMTAGTGIYHSEYNASTTNDAKLLQIWIKPNTLGLKPGHEQKSFKNTFKQNEWNLIASKDGRDNSLTIHQDVSVYAGKLNSDNVEYALLEKHSAWVQVAKGTVKVNGTLLKNGDAASFEGENGITFTDAKDAEVIIFDLIDNKGK